MHEWRHRRHQNSLRRDESSTQNATLAFRECVRVWTSSLLACSAFAAVIGLFRGHHLSQHALHLLCSLAYFVDIIAPSMLSLECVFVSACSFCLSYFSFAFRHFFGKVLTLCFCQRCLSVVLSTSLTITSHDMT